MRPTRQVRSLLVILAALAVALVGGILGVSATMTLTQGLPGDHSAANPETPPLTTAPPVTVTTLVIAMRTEPLTTAGAATLREYGRQMSAWLADGSPAYVLELIEAPPELAAAHAAWTEGQIRLASAVDRYLEALRADDTPALLAAAATVTAAAYDPSMLAARKVLEDALGFGLGPGR